MLRPYLRRRLAELLGGWINIELLTFSDLGEKLGLMAQLAEGRMPMPALAEQVLIRQIAGGARGYFKPVAEAPGLAPRFSGYSRSSARRTSSHSRSPRLTPARK